MNEYVEKIKELAKGNPKATQILYDILGRNKSLNIYNWLLKKEITGGRIVEYMEEHKINSQELADKVRFELFLEDSTFKNKDYSRLRRKYY